MRINKASIRKAGFTAASAVLVLSAAVCTVIRLSSTGCWDSAGIFAARTVMPQAGYEYYKHPSRTTAAITEEASVSKPEEESAVILQEQSALEVSAAAAPSGFEEHPPSEEALAAYQKAHEGEETYPVLEFTSIQGNMAYGGIQVKNSSSLDLDIKEELSGKLGFQLEKTDQPQVLIYHTHTSESFLEFDTGYYYESFYPRSTDPAKNVCAVGEEIAKSLNAAGICTLHDTTIHDDPSYNGAYYRSYDTVESYLEKYPSIKVVLDIHRDGIGTENQRSKPVFTVNGKKAAQMMILAGYNYDGSEEFRHWEYNLRFALQIQKQAQEKYPDMVRPLHLGDFMYNMNINSGSLLIEIGADSNTLEEVRYTGYLLGDVLADVLKNTA